MIRTTIVLLTLCAPAARAAPTWQWEHPTPQGGGLDGLAGSGATVYAVGERGTVLVSPDGGVVWKAIASGIAEDLHAVAVADKLVVAVGEHGSVLRSRDGTTFERRPAATQASLVGVALAGTTVLAVADDGTVVRSTNGGDSFAVLAGVKLGDYRRATAIAIASSGAYIATTEGVWRSADSGTTWKAAFAETAQRIVVAADGTVYVLAGSDVTYHNQEACNSCMNASYESVALYRTADGASWQRRTLSDPSTTNRSWGAPKAPVPPNQPPASQVLGGGRGGLSQPMAASPWQQRRALAIGPAGELFATGDGSLFVSTDKAASFTTRRGRDGVLWATKAGLVATGDKGALAISRDRGATWLELVARLVDPDKALWTIAATGTRVFAAGMDGIAIVRDPNGRWSKLALPIGKSQRLEAMAAIDDDHVVIVGGGGVILVSSDGGKTFQHRASDSTADLSAVFAVGAHVWAAGRDTLLHSPDRGASWESLPNQTLYSPRALWGTGPDNLYVLAGEAMHSKDGGKTWTVIDPSFGGMYGGIHGVGDDITLVGMEGRIVHSSDRGKTWRPVASGTKLELHRIWGRGDELFVAGGVWNAEGVVLHSSDRGKTWRTEPVPASVPLHAITGTAAGVFVLGEGSAILRRLP